MISRRLLRIKTLKLLYGHAGESELNMEQIERELQLSMQKTYDLYHFLFSAVIHLADYAEERINIGLQKFRPTIEEANPNKKFVNSDVLFLIRSNEALRQYCDKHRLSWGGDNMNIITDIFNHLSEREYYKDYMSSETRSYEEDLKFIKNIFMYEFEDNPILENMLEEQSYWWSADEVGYALGSILRTLDSFATGQSPDTPLAQARRSREDEQFALRLLTHSLKNYHEYWNKAMLFVQNWEADRVAAMDMNLITLGYSEAREFPNIPVKVSINEYVEIAKYYSTHNSHIFVNGVLDRMVQQGITDGEIVKEGRGLVSTTVIHRRGN